MAGVPRPAARRPVPMADPSVRSAPPRATARRRVLALAAAPLLAAGGCAGPRERAGAVGAPATPASALATLPRDPVRAVFTFGK